MHFRKSPEDNLPQEKLRAVACIFATLLSLAAPGALYAQQEERVSTSLTDSLVAVALGLEFGEFDQDMDGGWRALEAQGEYAQAAELLDRYRHERTGLLEWQKTLLAFHAGQMYAFAGRNADALVSFREAQFSDAVGPGWEPYVRATIAFLKRNKAALVLALDDLKKAPQIGGPDPNIRVVEALVQHFESTYAKAYSSVSRDGN